MVYLIHNMAMTEKRFKNSDIISRAQEKQSIERRESETEMDAPASDFSFIEKENTLEENESTLNAEIQNLQVQKKQLKEEIEVLRRLKEKVKNDARPISLTVFNEKTVLPLTILVVAVLTTAGVYFLQNLDAGKDKAVNVIKHPLLSVFTVEEHTELAQIYMAQKDVFDREYDKLSLRVALINQLLQSDEAQKDNVLSQGDVLLKNEVFIEYQHRLGIMELQKILFEPDSRDVAEELKKGINGVKNEMVMRLKKSIPSGFSAQTQEGITTLANKMFLDVRLSAIDAIRGAARILK